MKIFELPECKGCKYYFNGGYGYNSIFTHYCTLCSKPIEIERIENTNFYKPVFPCKDNCLKEEG